MLRVVLLSVLVVYCTAQYRCPDLYSRHQVISSKYEEFTRLVEVRINKYDDIFSNLPYSERVICPIKIALEELKSLLYQCKQSAPPHKIHIHEKWIVKIDSLIQFSHGLCGLISSRGPEVGRVSESVVSFKEELSSFKSSFEAYDVSSCDGDYLQRLDSKLVELKEKWEQHQSILSSLSSRGRLYDSTKSGGHMNAFNSNLMSVMNSMMSNNALSQGNILDSSKNSFSNSTSTYAPTYGGGSGPQPYPGPRPQPYPGPIPYPGPLPHPGPIPGPQPYPGPIPGPQPYPGPRPQPYPGPIPYPAPLPHPGPIPGPQPYPGPIPGPQPHPQPYPDPAPYPGPEPYPGGKYHDSVKVGLHGNVGNTNYMGVSNSTLYDNTLSQSNILDSSKNTWSSSNYTNAPKYGRPGQYY